MRVVVRVLTNEINHASPSNHPFLLEYIWTVISPETDDSVKLRRGGQTPFLFLQISSESWGSFSNEFRTGLVFFLFFLFSTDGQALEQLDWKYVTILEEGMKLYAIALQVIT